MNNIAELLVQEYNKHIDTQAFMRFHQDWDGDMAERQKMCDRFMAKEMTVAHNAILLVGKKIWADLESERMCITETHWWKTRKFNYEGQPLSDLWINKIKQENEQDAAA